MKSHCSWSPLNPPTPTIHPVVTSSSPYLFQSSSYPKSAQEAR